MKTISTFFLMVSTLVCLADDGFNTVTKSTNGDFYTVTKQRASYLYTENRAYFDVIPAVSFTLDDFMRTNQKVQKKYDDEYSDGKNSVMHLDAFVVPSFDQKQFTMVIYSDRLLDPSEIHDIFQFIEDSMLAHK